MIMTIIYILTSALSMLPISPFRAALKYITGIDMLGFLNWFIPFDICTLIMQIWCAGMAIWFIFCGNKLLLKKFLNW